MSLFSFFLGIVILTTGRRLYWLFLGGVGFAFGFELAERLVHGHPHSVILVIAMLAGVIGALLAVFLQKFAVMAGGFIGGGYLLIVLFKELGITTAHYYWLIFLIGGISGALLMRVLFGWTLIVLSSLMGSVLVVQTLQLAPGVKKPLFIFLTALGIVVQYGLSKRKPPPRRI
jgi:hypothetical protein